MIDDSAAATLPLCQSGWRSHSHSATQPLCQSGLRSHSPTLRLCQSGLRSHSATRPEWLEQPLSHSATLPEWVEEAVSHPATLPDWLTQPLSYSAALPEWLTQPLWQSGWGAEWLGWKFSPLRAQSFLKQMLSIHKLCPQSVLKHSVVRFQSFAMKIYFFQNKCQKHIKNPGSKTNKSYLICFWWSLFFRCRAHVPLDSPGQIPTSPISSAFTGGRASRHATLVQCPGSKTHKSYLICFF